MAAPCFFQFSKQSSFVQSSTDYAIFDVRLMIEGSCHVIGVPLEAGDGATISERIESLGKMQAEKFLELAKSTQGWHYKLTPKLMSQTSVEFLVIGVGYRMGMQSIGLRHGRI